MPVTKHCSASRRSSLREANKITRSAESKGVTASTMECVKVMNRVCVFTLQQQKLCVMKRYKCDLSGGTLQPAAVGP